MLRRVIDQRIQAAIHQRNAGQQVADCYRYKQLFNFRYSDGQAMLTVGGVIYQEKEAGKLKAAEFSTLPFVKSGNAEYRIPAPLLTYKEMIELDAKLPAAAATLDAPGVPDKDIKGYAEVYRYFPRFVDADF